MEITDEMVKRFLSASTRFYTEKQAPCIYYIITDEWKVISPEQAKKFLDFIINSPNT